MTVGRQCVVYIDIQSANQSEVDYENCFWKMVLFMCTRSERNDSILMVVSSFVLGKLKPLQQIESLLKTFPSTNIFFALNGCDVYFMCNSHEHFSHIPSLSIWFSSSDLLFVLSLALQTPSVSNNPPFTKQHPSPPHTFFQFNLVFHESPFCPQWKCSMCLKLLCTSLWWPLYPCTHTFSPQELCFSL